MFERPLVAWDDPVEERMRASNKKPEPADAHIGRRVQKRRRELGLSQEKLGEQLGVTFQQVQKYEKGTNRIGAGRLHSIAEVLQTPVAFFFDGLSGPRAGGMAESEEQPSLEDRRAVGAEATRLADEFERIADPKIRQSVLDLVRSLAGTSGQVPASKP